MSRVILHAGLPRTATTALQSVVMPAMKNYHYLGKPAGNTLIKGAFKPAEVSRQCIAAIKGGQDWAKKTKKQKQTTKHTKNKIRIHGWEPEMRAESQALVRIWIDVLKDMAAHLDDKPLIYSDESLVESVSGLVARLVRGDWVPLEQMHKEGFLEDVKVCIVLRDPLEFLRASYYKAMEFRLGRNNVGPISFDEYLSCQAQIYRRSPTASRLFLANHAQARAHFSRICPNAVITTYRELYESDHVLDTLLGEKTGETPIRLSSLPRENKSWRDSAVNEFILKSKGVPAGSNIEQYAQTFEHTLSKYPLPTSAALN